ncbi:hypothetical protein [Rhizobium leguminosarum]|uniref:hypothetical protein n=1 Tax=Rhizobium leguminosarum TaxID=384 RepID=UPI001FE17232|nr:hypothetical protein [Rhizobium leguminosarum]
MTPAEFAQTLNPRRDPVLRSRNGSAPQPAATEPTAATKNPGANSKLDKTWGQGRYGSTIVSKSGEPIEQGSLLYRLTFELDYIGKRKSLPREEVHCFVDPKISEAAPTASAPIAVQPCTCCNAI